MGWEVMDNVEFFSCVEKNEAMKRYNAIQRKSLDLPRGRSMSIQPSLIL